MRPGDYCKPREEDRCDCDSRGTIPNTQCDANTQECQCKVRVTFNFQTFKKCGRVEISNMCYNKTCLKRPLKNRQNKCVKDKW